MVFCHYSYSDSELVYACISSNMLANSANISRKKLIDEKVLNVCFSLDVLRNIITALFLSQLFLTRIIERAVFDIFPIAVKCRSVKCGFPGALVSRFQGE